MKETIKAVLCKTGEEAVIAEIENSVDGIRTAVGGHYEGYCLFNDPVIVLCREDGKWNTEVKPNRAIFESTNIRDVIHGDFIIVSTNDDEDLSEELAEKYKSKFLYPDYFIPTIGGMMVIAGSKIAELKQKDI